MVGSNIARVGGTCLPRSIDSHKSQSYVATAGTINLPSHIPSNTPVTATFTPPSGMDLSGARVVWEAVGQEPAYGSSYNITTTNGNAVWIEAEAQWPDGRRSFASFNNMPVVSVAASSGTVSRASQSTGTGHSPVRAIQQFL